MMGQCRLLNCNRCTTLVWGADDGEAVHVWGRGVWEISVPSPQFFCELKTALKNYHNLKNRTHGIDNFESSTSVREEFQLEMRKLVSMTTDDTSVMLDQTFRFTGILKQETDVSLMFCSTL